MKKILSFLVYIFAFAVACALVASTGGIILIPIAIFFIVKWLRGKSPSKSRPSSSGAAGGGTGRNTASKTTAPPPAHKTCGHCGAQNDRNAIYCENCGHKL